MFVVGVVVIAALVGITAYSVSSATAAAEQFVVEVLTGDSDGIAASAGNLGASTTESWAQTRTSWVGTPELAQSIDTRSRVDMVWPVPFRIGVNVDVSGDWLDGRRKATVETTTRFDLRRGWVVDTWLEDAPGMQRTD
ncbi:MAG: hypothetical protein CVT59_05115 [Actinobacteria bacterium HGW-Actinobacteria-1]|nr:MAG: hypothetical protein CVT59_05115 [Actinobacteria bacterium HGW-Actinobacteria-1]